MMRRTLIIGLLAACLTAGTAAAQTAPRGLAGIDWGAIAAALRRAFGSLQVAAPTPTATAVPPTATVTQTATRTRTGTITATSTRTRTFTRTATATPTQTATRTASATRTATHTATATRTATDTRPPTLTPTPTPTTDPASFTATPDSSELGLGTVEGLPPAQKLASAMLVFPYVVSEVGSGLSASGGIASGATEDTRIQLINMSGETQTLQCFYVRAQVNQLNRTECFEVGFFVSLTAEQPLTWLASEGTNNPLTFTAVPPFDGLGELKCAVIPRRPQVSAHNVIQGRAVVFDAPSGETAGYSAIGFQRLSDGDFSGVVNLDGFTYEACPQRLHFQVLASNSVSSLLVLVPCAQDLLTQTPTSTTVQLAIVNEFEQVFSSSFNFACHTVRSFSTIGTLRSSLLGTYTAHVVVRGVSSPLTGLVVDRFDALGQRQTTVNEPFLEGGRDATVIFP